MPRSARSGVAVPGAPGVRGLLGWRQDSESCTMKHGRVVLDSPWSCAVLTKKQLARLRAAPVEPGSNRVELAISIAGVSQATVAQAIGVTQPYVSDVVRARYETITLRNARKFAQFFGCLVEDLFPVHDG